MKAIYPGTFDPITFGHLDLIKRGVSIFGELIVAIADNHTKGPLFSLEIRKRMVEETLKDIKNVQITTFSNLLVEFAEHSGAKVILRGLRAVSDFEYEFQMALMNKKISPNVETFFMMPDESYTYLSSFNIKQIARMGGDVSKFVPPNVERQLVYQYQQRK